MCVFCFFSVFVSVHYSRREVDGVLRASCLLHRSILRVHDMLPGILARHQIPLRLSVLRVRALLFAFVSSLYLFLYTSMPCGLYRSNLACCLKYYSRVGLKCGLSRIFSHQLSRYQSISTLATVCGSSLARSVRGEPGLRRIVDYNSWHGVACV